MKVVLKIRKENSNWIFDDFDLGISKEPFVEGSSEAIDFVSRELKLDLTSSKLLIVSTEKFEKSFETKLLHFNKQTNWSTYFFSGFGIHKLCPVLLIYFKEPPKKIYFTVE